MNCLLAYLSEDFPVGQANPYKVHPWGCSTQQTCPVLYGRTSCLAARSAGSHCPSSPRPQHNSWFVDLQRDNRKEVPQPGPQGNSVQHSWAPDKERGTQKTHVCWAGIRITFPGMQGKKDHIRDICNNPPGSQEGHQHTYPNAFSCPRPAGCLPIPTHQSPPGDWSYGKKATFLTPSQETGQGQSGCSQKRFKAAGVLSICSSVVFPLSVDLWFLEDFSVQS